VVMSPEKFRVRLTARRTTAEVVMSPEKFRVRLTARRTTAKSDGEGQASQKDQGQQTKVIYC